MFDLINGALNIVTGVVDDVAEEVVGKRIIGKVDVVRLVETGTSVYAIADVTGLSVDAVRKLMDD